MITDTKTQNLRVVLHQIWASLYIEYVVKNPLSPAEHTGGVGVANLLFESGLDSFVVCVGFFDLAGYLADSMTEYLFCILNRLH